MNEGNPPLETRQAARIVGREGPDAGQGAEPRRGVRPTLRNRALLVLASFGLCGLVLLGGEVLCRLFTDIPLLGNSRDLFVGDAYGSSKGNAKNVRAVSFGVDVFTDANGFRCDPSFPATTHPSAILILGDSVAFGGGVEESRTFAGLLRRKLTSTTIYNSSVIGYDLNDYRNVADVFVPRHPEIRRVYLAYCLNDISPASAEEIDRFLGNAPMGRSVERARSIPIVSGLNDFLRARSKLYLLLKNLLINPPRKFFLADLARYQFEEGRFEEGLKPLADIDRSLEERKMDFTVLLMPYRVQIDSNDVSYGVPQRRVSEYCRKRGIRCMDLMSSFKDSGIGGRLFLGGDPMHLSEAGHRVVFQTLMKDLGASEPDGSAAKGS